MSISELDRSVVDSPEQPTDARAGGSLGTLDAQRTQFKSRLIKIACDIAAVAQRYKIAHQTLFGFSLRKVVHALQHKKSTDFAVLEIELDTIAQQSKCIQQAIENTDFNNLPKHADTIIAIRDALKEYIDAVSGATSNLNQICRNLHRESARDTEFTDYSAGQFQDDKAAYDATVQEFRRCGTKLTALFADFNLG